jgi:TM2 domain-containing membrane protein YozV
MYCPECGRESPDDAKYCSSCGASLQVDISEDPTINQNIPNEEEKHSDVNDISVKKSPSTAAILSFLFLGSGQVYNGQLSPAILLLVVNFVGVLVAGFYNWILGGIIIIAAYLGSISHAYSTAKKMNNGSIAATPYKNSDIVIYIVLLLGLALMSSVAADALTAKAYVSANVILDDNLQNTITYVYGGFYSGIDDYALNYTLLTTATNVGYVDAHNIRATIYLYSPRDGTLLLSKNVAFGDLPPRGQATQHIPITLETQNLNDFKRLYEYGPLVKVVVTNVEN